MSNIIFIDTETNGKPIDFTGSMRDLGNWPRIIQLGWVKYNTEGEQLGKRCSLIRPDGWTIPNEKFWIDNGYSTERNELEGIDAYAVLEHFALNAKDCDLVVAHNMQFDYNVLGAEMLRYGVSVGKKLQRFCTMEAGIDVCKIPASAKYKNGHLYKWPKLEELYYTIFGEKLTGAHDAMADVMACARCYFKMQHSLIIQ